MRSQPSARISFVLGRMRLGGAGVASVPVVYADARRQLLLQAS